MPEPKKTESSESESLPAGGGGPPDRPSKRSRLSEEERKRLWREAVMAKAKQIKNLADVVILLMLAAVIGAHALPFVHINKGTPQEWGPKRGYAILLDLVTPYDGTDEEFKEADPYWAARLPEPPALLWGVQPRMLYARDPRDGRPLSSARGGPMVRFMGVYPATILAYFILLVPIGAVVVLVLYLLDYGLWMGRVLPIMSCVWGFGSVAYLVFTRVPMEGTWNALRWAWWGAWYLLLIPLFLLGCFSLLRLIVSQRWKRYVWAGLEVPEHLKPAEPEEDEEEDKEKGKDKSKKKGKEKGRASRRGRVAAAKAAAGSGKDKKEKAKAADEAKKTEETGKTGKTGESKEAEEGKEAERVKEPDAPKEGGAEAAEAEGPGDAGKGEDAGDEKAQEGEKAGEAGEDEKE